MRRCKSQARCDHLRGVRCIQPLALHRERTLHFHDTPDGLTPAVLAQVFAHDIEPILGEVHIDAHAAIDCDDPSHAHHPDCGHDHTGGAS